MPLFRADGTGAVADHDAVFLGAVQNLKPAPNYTLTIVSLAFTCAGAISAAWIGIIQQDAHSIPVIAKTIIANGGLAKTAELAATTPAVPLPPPPLPTMNPYK